MLRVNAQAYLIEASNVRRPAVTPRQPRRRSALVVLVVAAPPDARLVAAPGGAVEPLVHAPETVHAARIGGIGVVDDAALEHERADARPLARVRGRVGSGHCREHRRPVGARALGDRLQRRLAPVVVFDASLALLFLGEPDAEVDVEVAAERGRPGERPSHPERTLAELDSASFPPASRTAHELVVAGIAIRWFASGDRLNAFDPASGKLLRSIEVAGHAGTAFDGQHLFQLAKDRIQKIDPKTGRVLATIPAPGGGGDSGLTWAEGTLWVGQYRDRRYIKSIPRQGRFFARS